MGRKSKQSKLFLYLNKQHVGVLQRISSGKLSLIYDQDWLESPEALPISLSLPLQEAPHEGERVDNFFDNLLPDNESIRNRIQRRFAAPSNSCFDLLTHIGNDCVGALRLLPEPIDDYRQDHLRATTLNSTEIADLLKNYRTAPLGMQANTEFRITIAGAQEKTALLCHNNKWCLPQGTTATTHIFKLPIGRIDHSGIDLSESVENEWLCLKILKAFGLPVNDAEIKVFDGVKVLVCTRFDRSWNDDRSMILRLVQEDLCQALGVPPALKYETDGGPGITEIMSFLRGSVVAKDDCVLFFTSCFLFWVLGAIDGHAKNFSIFISPGGRFRLTPLYDVISAYPIAEKQQIALQKISMAMGVKGKNKHYRWHEILPRHWLAMAEQVHLPERPFQLIIEEIFDRINSVIAEVESELPSNFPESIAASIFDGMRHARRKLSKG